jgi:hypothetical protein
MLFHAYAVKSGDLLVYDLQQRAVKFRGGGDVQEGNRNIMLDREGNAYFGTKDGRIGRYNRSNNKVEMTRGKLPAGSLRASTDPTHGGVIFGITQSGRMFAYDSKTEAVADLGPSVGSEYTAVMVLSPDNWFIYYAPGAHGSGAKMGTPIVQYDIAKKSHKVLGFLNPAMRRQFNYNIGGSYNIKLSADGSTLFCIFNGAPLDPAARKEQTFGQPCLVVLHIPAEER